jgi:hypothetical protein
MLSCRVILWLACVVVMPLSFTGNTIAQGYPVKTVRIVVPFAPGGPNDILARVIGQKLTEAWGQQVVVDNRPGGGTVIGTELVAKSPPDGYNLLMVSASTTTNPTLLKKLPFDTLRDLALVIYLANSANVLIAHPSLPARSVKELIALAKSRPDQVAYGSGGNGTSTHLSGELLAQMGKVKMLHVPYKGAGPANIALLSGQITWIFGNALSAVPPPCPASRSIRGTASRCRAPRPGKSSPGSIRTSAACSTRARCARASPPRAPRRKAAAPKSSAATSGRKWTSGRKSFVLPASGSNEWPVVSGWWLVASG